MVVLSRVADALDVFAVKNVSAHIPQVTDGVNVWSFADLAVLYRAGDEFVVSFINNGVSLCGVDEFIATLQ